jgi:NAD(P)-dependent dehydrogenase (short-subunit alcohol dehydrogenase family)
MSDHELDGCRVVVVGGTSGMGRGAVQLAERAGAEVIAAGRRTDPGIDVTDEASVRALFDTVGEFDHLFVTASPGSPGEFLEQDVAAARAYMDGKFFGSWACARYGAPHVRPGGSITFLSGGLAARPDPGTAMVASAFAAVEALGRAQAVELAPLRVNTIRPGFVDSDTSRAPCW